jgi:uncharacterized protein (TIGR02285 family)
MMMKQKENVCSVPLHRTPERDQFIEFSIPYTIVLSNALIMLESQKSKFKPLINKAVTISLEGVIQKGYRIGVAKSRVYRGIIDEVLKKYKDDPRIIEHVSSQNMVNSLIGMMAAGRIDGLIGYLFEAQYVAKTMENKISITSIPIAGMDQYGLTAVGCSKTEKGKEIIKKLNAIIMEYRMTPEFIGFHEYLVRSVSFKKTSGIYNKRI